MSSLSQIVNVVSNTEFPLKIHNHNLKQPCQPLDISEQSPSIYSKEIAYPSHLSNNRLSEIQKDLYSSPISSLIRPQSHQFNAENSELNPETHLLKIDQNLYRFLHLFDGFNNQIAQKIEKKPILTEQILMIWNLLIICNFIGICIYLPLKITLFLLIFIPIKIIDIIILLNQKYFEEGQQIDDKLSIHKRYYQCFFLLDLIHLCTLLLLQINSINQHKMIKWIFILIVLITSIRRVSSVINQLRFQFNLMNISQELTYNIFKIAILLHIVTSLWLDTIYQLEYEHEYEEKHNFINSYLNSMVIVISIATFNSSYKPQQQEACILYIATSIVSLYLLAFILHSSKQLFSKNQETQDLSQILNAKKLSSTQKFKILSSVENKQMKIKSQLQFAQILKQLPLDLQQEIVISERFEILEKYFNSYEKQSLINLAKDCEEISCHPNTLIITQDIQDDQSIYFILEGQIDVLMNGQRTFLHRLGKGKIFGEISFLTQHPRTATIKSYKSCHFLKLARSKFLISLTEKDRQMYFCQRDSLIFGRNYPFRCFCCGKYTHQILECNILNFSPSFNWVLDQDVSQPRKKFLRRGQKQHFGSLKLINFFKDNQQELLELYEVNNISVEDFTIQATIPYEMMSNPQFLSHNKIKMEKLRQDPQKKSEFELEILEELSANNPSEIEFLKTIKREISQKNKYNSGQIRFEDQTIYELSHLEDQCSILDLIKNKEIETKPANKLLSDCVQSISDMPVAHKDQYVSNKFFNSSESLRYYIQMMARIPKGLSNFGKQYSPRNPIQSLSRSRSKSSKKYSSNFQPFQQQESISEYYRDFEKMHSFSYFHPNYNYDSIITKLSVHY